MTSGALWDSGYQVSSRSEGIYVRGSFLEYDYNILQEVLRKKEKSSDGLIWQACGV